MSLLETLRTGCGALCANKLRSVLTMLGIVVGVAAVVCMVSVGAGAESEVAEKIRTLGANLLLVRPGAEVSGATRLEAGTAHTLTEGDAAAIRRELRAVQVAAPVLSRPVHLVAGNRNWATIVAGIADDYLVAREWPLAAGRSFSPAETEVGGKVAIIGADIVQQLFDGRSGFGETVRIGNVPFTVIGVLDKKGLGPAGISQDDVVFIPLAAAESRVPGSVRGNAREALDFILVKVADQQAMPEVAEQIADLLRRRHKLRSDAAVDFRIQDPADVLTARQSAMRTLGFLLMAIASVSLIVGGISIMNIMLVSVSERTREIGLRMAVGARRRDIGVQFLIEAVTLALAGAGLGVLVGGASATAIALAAGWPVLISPAAVVIACGFAALVGVAFGVYPAYHASRLDPIVAFRRE